MEGRIWRRTGASATAYPRRARPFPERPAAVVCPRPLPHLVSPIVGRGPSVGPAREQRTGRVHPLPPETRRAGTNPVRRHHFSRQRRTMTRSAILSARLAARAAALAAAVAALVAPRPAAAQYFGRNKVQYETFDFRVLRTPRFDIHYYPAESTVVADAARMAERWYARHSQIMRDTFQLKPLIFYADHPDFQQTNVIGGFIGQGTGGVTESIRNRVVMPFTGVYADNDHVLGHELVHVFQYDIAGSAPGGMQGMNN